MKITIEIDINAAKGSAAFSDEVAALLPTREQLHNFRKAISPVVLPVKFRVVDRQTQRSFITFED